MTRAGGETGLSDLVVCILCAALLPVMDNWLSANQQFHVEEESRGGASVSSNLKKINNELMLKKCFACVPSLKSVHLHERTAQVAAKPAVMNHTGLICVNE